MAVPRNHAFAGAVNGKIYVIGGRTGHGFILSATNTDVVEEYNPATDMWSAPKERMPTARSGGGCGTDGRRIYVAGGEVTTKAARRRVSRHRGVRAGDQFLDHAALHADAASRRRGRGDRQSLSPGERDDHVRRGDGDARPEARSPHGVARRAGAAVQSTELHGEQDCRSTARRGEAPSAGRRSPTRATTSTAPKAKRCSRNTRGRSRSCGQLPDHDTHSWNWWWNTHWIKGPPAFLWEDSRKHKTEVIASLPPDIQAFAEAVWNGCQAHPYNPADPEQYQQWYFLPWHRLMLYQFEQDDSRGAAR